MALAEVVVNAILQEVWKRNGRENSEMMTTDNPFEEPVEKLGGKWGVKRNGPLERKNMLTPEG